MTAYFSSEIMKADSGMTSLKYREREECQPRIMYLKKYIFENKGKKIFLDKLKLGKSNTSRYIMKEMLKEILHTEGK